MLSRRVPLARSATRLPAYAFAALLAVFAACKAPPKDFAPPVAVDVGKPQPPRDYEALVRALYQGEADYERRWPIEYRVRVCEGLLQDLQRAALDLGAQMGTPYFAAQVKWSWPTLGTPAPLVGEVTEARHAAGAEEARTAGQVADAWRAWLAPFSYLERVTFKLKDGSLIPGGGYRSTVALELAGKERGGGFRRDYGMAELDFAPAEHTWMITRFVVTQLATQRLAHKFFDDVTESWLAAVPAATRATLREHSASDEIHRMGLDEKHPLAPSLDALGPLAMDAHPGVVVVDLNGDHYDDLFVWDVLGESVFLENQAGHGFVDRTASYGLGFRDVSAAAFADLDNDGSIDLVLGRWFAPAEIYAGANGRFYPSSSSRMTALPPEVSTISLADVDGDGRLDIYLGTASHDFHGHLALALQEGEAALRRFDAGEAARLREALPAARAAQAAGRFDINLFQLGPRNVFLLNQGDGRFSDATHALGLDLYRNTLEAAFGDVDSDGHPDLFVANDFAPANLYLWRNGRYVDVSAQNGADKVFFGMGASFGDFDNDGDLDLYVSAMQSTAGKRIMRDAANFSPEHDEVARRARIEAARGSTLLGNDGKGGYTDRTAEPAFAAVRNAQWSYSGQFIDADGDGFLDVFSPNGFFTSSLSPDDPFVRDL